MPRGSHTGGILITLIFLQNYPSITKLFMVHNSDISKNEIIIIYHTTRFLVSTRNIIKTFAMLRVWWDRAYVSQKHIKHLIIKYSTLALALLVYFKGKYDIPSLIERLFSSGSNWNNKKRSLTSVFVKK